MNNNNTLLKLILAGALLAFAASSASAATQRTNFRNDSTVNHIFLFADDSGALPGPEIEFSAVDLRNGFSAWTLETLTPALAVFHGADTAPNAGRFRLTFEYNVPQVSFQWAEVLFDSVTNTYTSVTGTAYYDRNLPWRWSYDNTFAAANRAFVDNYFGVTPAPVPLPNSMVMLLSAAAFLGFSRRHAITQAL